MNRRNVWILAFIFCLVGWILFFMGVAAFLDWLF